MILGTHNSATGGKLLWWLRPIGGIINLTSKCQDTSVDEQLKDGIKLFNLQVAFVGGKWRFTHGLAVYKEDVFETIAKMRACATKDEPIYFQLYLDKCFWCKQNIEEFEKLINHINDTLCCEYFCMLPPWVEGTDIAYKGGNFSLRWEERYWSKSWGKMYGKSWLDKIPLPRRHARKYNEKYKKECVTDYLMLDFYNYE